MAVTIYEIAERAGVSSSTVSRVLRGTVKESWKSSSERAERIRRVAEEMGYRPNLRARAFSEQKTMGIGLICGYGGQVFEPISREIVQGITEVLTPHGYHLVLVPYDDTTHWQDMLLGRRLDGCFLMNFVTDEVSEVLSSCDLPAVLIGVQSELAFPQFKSDDHGGAYRATRHLLGHGHRHLAYYVNEEIRDHYSVDVRLRGVQDAVAEFGEGATCEIYLRTSEQEIVNALISRGNQTTGIVCYCDIEAISLSHVLPKYGLNIPRDISLVGFNNVFPTSLMTPPLTVVGFDTKSFGEAAGRAMLDQITEEEPTAACEPPKKQVFEQNLLVRGSTGPVPESASS